MPKGDWSKCDEVLNKAKELRNKQESYEGKREEVVKKLCVSKPIGVVEQKDPELSYVHSFYIEVDKLKELEALAIEEGTRKERENRLPIIRAVVENAKQQTLASVLEIVEKMIKENKNNPNYSDDGYCGQNIICLKALKTKIEALEEIK